MRNEAGEVIYYNEVVKRGLSRYIVKAISGQAIRGRDGQRLKSRTFVREYDAIAWLARNGYEADFSPWEK